MESFKALVEKSLKGFQSLAPPPKSLKDEKLSHASTCLKLADKLYKKEATLLKPPLLASLFADILLGKRGSFLVL
jgi:hypothetical protein